MSAEQIQEQFQQRDAETDLTSMIDVAFLIIIFFMLTSVSDRLMRESLTHRLRGNIDQVTSFVNATPYVQVADINVLVHF